MHINVLDVDVCVCRCWIVMAERGIENKSTDISFLFIFIYLLLAASCSRVSPVYPPRHTTTFYACQIILKTRQAASSWVIYFILSFFPFCSFSFFLLVLGSRFYMRDPALLRLG